MRSSLGAGSSFKNLVFQMNRSIWSRFWKRAVSPITILDMAPSRRRNQIRACRVQAQAAASIYPNNQQVAQSQSTNDSPPVVGWCHTRVKKAEFSFTWAIEDFPLLVRNPGEKLESTHFFAGPNNESEWCLRAYPNGTGQDRKDYLSLFLVLISCEVSAAKTIAPSKFTLSILNSRNEKTSSQTVENYTFPEKGGDWGYKAFILRSDLLKESNALLPYNRLTILCEGSVGLEAVTESGRDGQYHKRRRSEEFRSLFENQKFCDITLLVGQQSLHAHKAILAARSPVFAAMFEHNMKERKHNRVTIVDVEYNVLREMMVYIYTDKSPNMKGMANELLVVANKYDLPGLKIMCEESLGLALTVENAADMLVFADMHCAKQLKTRIIQFVSINAKDISKMESWKSMASKYPHIILEAFEALASR